MSSNLALHVLELLVNSEWVWPSLLGEGSVQRLVALSVPDGKDRRVFAGLLSAVVSASYPLPIFRGKVKRFTELLVDLAVILHQNQHKPDHCSELAGDVKRMLHRTDGSSIQYKGFLARFRPEQISDPLSFLTNLRTSLGLSKHYALGDLYSAAAIEQLSPLASAKVCSQLYMVPILFTAVAMFAKDEMVGRQVVASVEKSILSRSHRPGILLAVDVRAACTWMDNSAGTYQHMQVAIHNLAALMRKAASSSADGTTVKAVYHELHLLVLYMKLSVGCKHGSSFCRFVAKQAGVIHRQMAIQKYRSSSSGQQHVNSIREYAYHVAEAILDHSLVAKHISEDAIWQLHDRLSHLFSSGTMGLKVTKFYTLVVSYARLIIFLVMILEAAVDEARIKSVRALIGDLVLVTAGHASRPRKATKNAYFDWAQTYLTAATDSLTRFLTEPGNNWAVEVIEDLTPDVGELYLDVKSSSARVASAYKDMIFHTQGTEPW